MQGFLQDTNRLHSRSCLAESSTRLLITLTPPLIYSEDELIERALTLAKIV